MEFLKAGEGTHFLDELAKLIFCYELYYSRFRRGIKGE